MGRTSKSQRNKSVVDVAVAAGTAIGAVQTGRERLNAFLLPFAWWVGALGLMALCSCGVLAAMSEDDWPEILDPDQLPLYAMGSLVAGSLLGWGCMQTGLARLRRAVGWRVGGWFFVLLPIACCVVVLLDGRLFAMTEWEYGAHVALAVRWYPPILIGLCLVSFVVGEARKEGEGGVQRGAWSLLLIGPYVLLMATLVLGLQAPGLTETLEETLEEMGSGAIVAQVAFGYFLAAGASSS